MGVVLAVGFVVPYALATTGVRQSNSRPVPEPASARALAARPTASGCTSNGLVVWLDTQGNGTAGSIYYKLNFTNLSGHACTLFGYPGVSAVNLSGHGLGSAATRDRAQKPALVRLREGASATASLRIIDTGVFSPSACRPLTAAGLRVYPPGQTKAKLVPFPFSACSRAGLAYLSIAPLAKP